MTCCGASSDEGCRHYREACFFPWGYFWRKFLDSLRSHLHLLKTILSLPAHSESLQWSPNPMAPNLVLYRYADLTVQWLTVFISQPWYHLAVLPRAFLSLVLCPPSTPRQTFLKYLFSDLEPPYLNQSTQIYCSIVCVSQAPPHCISLSILHTGHLTHPMCIYPPSRKVGVSWVW